MNNEEKQSTTQLGEGRGRDRRTLKHHREGVPAKTENGRRLYRLSDVDHLMKERPKPRSYDRNSEDHWLRELITKTILVGGAIEDVFAEIQKISANMKTLAKGKSLERPIIKEDMNRTSEGYGKQIGEFIVQGGFGGV